MKIDGRVIKANQTLVLNQFGMFDSLLYLLNDPKDLSRFLQDAKKVASDFQSIAF